MTQAPLRLILMLIQLLWKLWFIHSRIRFAFICLNTEKLWKLQAVYRWSTSSEYHTYCNHQTKQQKLIRLRISQPRLQLRRPQPVRWRPLQLRNQQLKWRPLRLRRPQQLRQTPTVVTPWLGEQLRTETQHQANIQQHKLGNQLVNYVNW